MSSELGMKPEDLLVVMVSESGLNPGAVEQKFKGSGLVGFMPDTLKGLGFKGTWKEFSQMQGQDQLDYVKKLVQNNMQLNGGPFTSAAQYYVANFWPIALKLPGIRQGDPDTAFIEENPAVVTDPKTGKKYSKKYYDLGYHISPAQESGAYKANPLFHGSVHGAITFGDMMKRADKIKQSPTYRQAVANMHQATGYASEEGIASAEEYSPHEDAFRQYVRRLKEHGGALPPPTEQRTVPPTPISPPPDNDVSSILDKYLQQVSAAEKNNHKLYKRYLPDNQILIEANTSNFIDAVEFARILSSVLEEELMVKSSVHSDGEKVEMECSIFGPADDCLNVVQQLSEATAEAFHLATAKIGGIVVKPTCVVNKKSSYQPINFKSASIQYRKFLLKFMKGTKW